MPNLLAFDTATEACAVALLANNHLYHYFEVVPQRHAELILGKIESLLSDAKTPLHTINAIAFGRGPGSFMGVRIATSVAQGLAFGIDCPVIPVSTLQILAQTAYQETKATQIVVGWDARMGGIYWGVYELSARGVMEPVMQDSLSNPNDIQLPAHGTWLVVGNVWKAYRVTLPGAARTDLYPQPAALMTLAQEKLRCKETQLPEEAEPIYLRQPV